jgi:hypothetical protein
MPREIFDQERPRSAKARRLDEAFDGCDQWTTAPPPPREGDAALEPWPPSASRTTGSAAAMRGPQGYRAA